MSKKSKKCVYRFNENMKSEIKGQLKASVGKNSAQPKAQEISVQQIAEDIMDRYADVFEKLAK